MLDVPDTDDNTKEFGRLETGKKARAVPQGQAVAFGERGALVEEQHRRLRDVG